MRCKLLGILLVLLMICCTVPQSVSAENGGVVDQRDGSATREGGKEVARRTILLYVCGADLESQGAMATHNFEQILGSRFSNDEDINLIVMTGGCKLWQLDDDDSLDNPNPYLVFPAGVNVPEDAVVIPDPEDPERKKTIVKNPKSRISGTYNQIWEARGADAVDENGNKDPNAGKLVLLDGDGITGKAGQAVKGEDELVTDSATLKTFINYGVEKYPAEKYDLIFWDHGGGPVGGYGADENYNSKKTYPEGVDGIMSFSEIVDALGDNKVVDKDGDGARDGKFDFVDFDACLMGNLELSLVLADYTRFYIASAETEPGYGQYYGPGDGECKGWLNELGDSAKDDIYNAEDGSYALGKVIVDDLNAFYSKEDGPGSGDNATLTVFDLEKLVSNTEFMDALTQLSQRLTAEAESASEENPILFYDELRSYYKSINYSDSRMFDLADMTAFLGVIDTEGDEEHSGEPSGYADLAEKFGDLFPIKDESNFRENDFMYAKCTFNEKTEANYHYQKSADGGETGIVFGDLFSSGLTAFFPHPHNINESIEYYEAMDAVLKTMPADDKRRVFLEKYEETIANYSAILYTGMSVGNIMQDEYAFYPEKNPYLDDKTKVDYDVVMNYWKNEESDLWNQFVVKHLQKRKDGVDQSAAWLKKLVTQMVDDAMTVKNIDAQEVQRGDKVGYRIEVKEANRRIFGSVVEKITAELPVLNSSIESLPERAKRAAKRYADFYIGEKEGINTEGNVWEIEPFEQKWYAINDAGGTNHVAMIYGQTRGKVAVPVLFGSSADGEEKNRLILLEFSKEVEGGHHKLLSLYYPKSDSGPMRLDPATLTKDLTLMPIMYIRSLLGKQVFYLPISKNSFVINKDNAASITLDYADVSAIPDIEDTTGDGKPLTRDIFITDLYDSELDITQRVIGSLKHISQASVKPAVYTGKELIPEVVCDGQTLQEGVDYTWEKVPDVIGEGEEEKYVTPEFKNAREYEVLLTGKGNYTGFSNTPFVIKKAGNPLAVTGKTATVSYKTQAQKIAVSKVLKFTKEGQGATTFAKAAGGNGAAKITINQKTGAVTLPKGLSAGTYTVTVKVKAAGNENYEASEAKSATIKVIVKKAANPLKIGAKTAKVKYGRLKKKAQKLAATKMIRFTRKGQGKKTYKLVSVKKGRKSFKKFFKINKKTGKVTIRKNKKMKKGTYKVKIKVKAAGNKNYKPSAVKTLVFKIKVR